MEFFKKTALAALVMGFSGAALALPNITILATGGTIAGGDGRCNAPVHVYERRRSIQPV